MKNTIITYFFFLIIKTGLSQGLIIDSTTFAKGLQMEVLRGDLPTSYSLKKYLPLPYPQAKGTCVAMSFSYARSILLAKNIGIIDRNKITTMCSFSPYYIYYRNKLLGDNYCDQGLDIEKVSLDVINNGMALLSNVEYPNYYPFTQFPLCLQDPAPYYPPSMSKDVIGAKKFKVQQIYRLNTTEQLKSAISQGMPVVLGMSPIPKSFINCKTDLCQIKPNESYELSGHAILAVAYDDNKYGGAVQIYNSWGDTWGNAGFTWIKYSDIGKWVKYGYALYADDKNITYTSDKNFDDSLSVKKAQAEIIKVFSIPGQKEKVSFSNKDYVKLFSDAYIEESKSSKKTEKK